MMAGLLNKRITLQKVTNVNTNGNITTSWYNLKTVWAEIEAITGREWFESGTINAEVDYKIKIRYQAGIKPQMRILYGTRIFDIRHIINGNEKNQFLQLFCKEVVR